MTTGVIFNIQRFSIHDGPGIRTTVFLKGCPLTCSWCHNPEGQTPEPELMLRPDRCMACRACVSVCEAGAISWTGGAIVTARERCRVCGACVEACYTEARELAGRSVTIGDVMAELLRDVPFYDESGGGVTVSGGEPLSQPAFLVDLLCACRKSGLPTALDTCGYAPWDVLERISPDVDLFLYDLKLMDESRHRAYTGVSNEPILRNLRRLSTERAKLSPGHRIILRVPIVPEVNDDDDNLRQIGAFVAELPSVERVDLLPYHRLGREKYRRLARAWEMPSVGAPPDARMTEIARSLRAFDLNVRIG